MVERGLDSNHIMITEFTNNHKLDTKDIGEAIFKLHEKIEHLQAQIYDLQNQNCEYEYRFKRMSLATDLRIPETRSSFLGECPGIVSPSLLSLPFFLVRSF